MDTTLAFVVGLVVGAFSLVGMVATYRAIRRYIRPTSPALILPRSTPSHVREGRILINGTKVQFNDDGNAHGARVGGYTREPGRGNYYLVTYPTLDKVPGRKWVPDTYVWELNDKLLRGKA